MTAILMVIAEQLGGAVNAVQDATGLRRDEDAGQLLRPRYARATCPGVTGRAGGHRRDALGPSPRRPAPTPPN